MVILNPWVSPFKVWIVFCLGKNFLTLFQLGGGHLVPGRSEMVCHFHRVWARFTKIHDFVPFNV